MAFAISSVHGQLGGSRFKITTIANSFKKSFILKSSLVILDEKVIIEWGSMKKILSAIFFITSYTLSYGTHSMLQTIVSSSNHPFSHNLDIQYIESTNKDASLTICCHGYGGNNQIINAVDTCCSIDDHLISFNFPDHGKLISLHNVDQSSFGTINEILPLIYILKKCVIDAKLPAINLYGFSAGAAAIINALALLNAADHHPALTNLGITNANKKEIITALEKGIIILDAPLKSIDEISDLYPDIPELSIMAARYRKNGMRPIDAIMQLKGLNLTILLFLQNPDIVVGNRDDQLFISRLQEANGGKTTVVCANNGGHNSFHIALWQAYQQIVDERKRIR